MMTTLGDAREYHDLSCWWNVVFCGESQSTPSQLPGEPKHITALGKSGCGGGAVCCEAGTHAGAGVAESILPESVACIRLAFTKKVGWTPSNSSHKTVAIAPPAPA